MSFYFNGRSRDRPDPAVGGGGNLRVVLIVFTIFFSFFDIRTEEARGKTSTKPSTKTTITAKETTTTQVAATTEITTLITSSTTTISSEKVTEETKCSPEQYVLFLKTHKAGSSTMSNIFFRYGDSRDLSFVLGSDTLIGWPTRFRIGQALAFDGTRPNFLCSHTRFNKKAMNHLFPKDASKYVTIVRNPVEQFESIFNYTQIGTVFGFGTDPSESLKAFLKNGIGFNILRKSGSSVLARNPQMFDLGLDFKFYQDAKAIKEYIEFLEKEFDLVLISDYFDESVVLMKRLLCWELDDVLYAKSNERLDKDKAPELSDDTKENIKRWNKADVLMYEHFNQTLWRRIEREGKEFYDDLANFRRMKQELKTKCFSDKPSRQLIYGNKYAKGFTLKSDLPSDLQQKCGRMTRTENNYLAYLRNKRAAKLVGINRAAPNEDDKEKVSWDAASDYKYVPVKTTR